MSATSAPRRGFRFAARPATWAPRGGFRFLTLVRQDDVAVPLGFGPQVVGGTENGEDELGSAFDAELAADVVNVGSSGVWGYAELFGDALVVVAIEDVFGDVELAFRQGGDAFDELPMFSVHQHGDIIAETRGSKPDNFGF